MDSFLSGFVALFDGITTNAPTLGAWIALALAVILLVCSAFVSGSEIAFFSLFFRIKPCNNVVFSGLCAVCAYRFFLRLFRIHLGLSTPI